jgi:predicted aspartyl protease
MGTFNVEIHVGDQRGERFEVIETLVDTGSTYTILPASLLGRLGVVPHRTSVFELADGSQREWPIGQTWVRLDGNQEMTLVVFGEDGVQPLLGAVTLEEFLLAPDPVRRRLVPVHGLAMRQMLR